ncbi:MAG: three-helix bundle dimerization domain-containing protein [Solirubrobacteraceae bacterium]
MPTELTPLLRYCLETTAVRLADEFHGVFSPETVRRYVEASYEQIGDRPTVGPNFLPVIIERFAREQLWRSHSRRALSRGRSPRSCSCANATLGAAR